MLFALVMAITMPTPCVSTAITRGNETIVFKCSEETKPMPHRAMKPRKEK